MFKNTADGHMGRGLCRLLARRPEIKVVVIVSGDAFFAPLATKLRQRGKHVIVAADPRRLSDDLPTAPNWVLPIGKLARNVAEIDRLQRQSKYLTFSFAVERIGLPHTDLARMIGRGYLVQDLVRRPGRGVRREIWLNPHSPVVQAVRGRAA